MSEESDRTKFINYFETFTTFNGNKYDEILDHVHNYALKYGLDETDMTLVASVSLKRQLSLLRIRKLLKCLLPRRYASQQTVHLIIQQLIKHKDGSILVIKQYLQWLIGVIEFNLVETKDDINTYYHLYCYFMKYEVIDVPASKLVYFLTTPDDVTQRLTLYVHSLYQTTNGRHFAALLYLFKCYRPDVVPDKIPVYPFRKSFGTLSNGFLENLLCAKTRINKNYDIDDDCENDPWNKFGSENPLSERINLIPKKSIPEENANKLHKLILSSNETSCVLSLLNNASGMYLLIFGGHLTHERLSYQLYFILYDAFLDRNPNVPYEEREKILDKITILQNYLQQPIPVVSKFLGQYLMRWDGKEHERNIYNILEWMHVKSFTEYRQCVLTYLLHIFKSNAVKTKCLILNCLGNFTVNAISLYVQREIREIPSKFLNVKEQYSFHEFIKELFVFLENLCLTAILMEPSNPAIFNTIVIIHGNILMAGNSAGINFKISKHIPYTALFSAIPNGLNAICRLINEFPSCVPKCVKQDFVECLLNNNAFYSSTNKLSVFYRFDKNLYSIDKMERKLHLKQHYAFLCYTYLMTNKTSQEESEKMLKMMKKKYIDIFKFLKLYA